MSEPCKHGHVDGAMHIRCPKCRIEELEAENNRLREALEVITEAYPAAVKYFNEARIENLRRDLSALEGSEMGELIIPTEYELKTYEWRKAHDAAELGSGYCGSCPLEIHIRQMRDPRSWIHGSIDAWRTTYENQPKQRYRREGEAKKRIEELECRLEKLQRAGDLMAVEIEGDWNLGRISIDSREAAKAWRRLLPSEYHDTHGDTVCDTCGTPLDSGMTRCSSCQKGD